MGRDYLYLNPGQHGDVDVFTYGAEGQPGGTGINAEIGNWDEKNNLGFTLIEILIVLVIIGITFGFALISFGDFGEGRRVLFAAEQLVNTLQLAQQQAILETSTLGLRINNESYQILQLQNNSQWKPISNKGVFKVTYFLKTRILT